MTRLGRTGVAQDELRRINTSAVLTRVHRDGPTLRSVLTEELGLNRSTIGDLTGQLDRLGLVCEEVPDEMSLAGSGARRSGRPSLMVSPRSDIVVLAMQIDVDRLVVALVGLGGVVLERRERPHERGSQDVEGVVVDLAEMAHELFESAAPRHCLGAGVSVPGAVRAADGLVRLAPNLGWSDVPFTEILAGRLRMPVVTGNDANLGVIAETIRGAAVGSVDVAFITGSVGIGGGFLVGGELLRGVHGYAGEVGHVPVDGQGHCRCGQVGCWEVKVGENTILEHAGRPLGGGSQAVAQVIEDARAEDKLALAAVDSAALWLGRGLRMVNNIFNPEVVVLGGFLGQVYQVRESMVNSHLHQKSLLDFAEDVQVRAALLGDDAPLMGAAEAAFAPLLDDPARVMARAFNPQDDGRRGSPAAV